MHNTGIGSFFRSLLGGDEPSNSFEKRMNIKVVKLFIAKCEELRANRQNKKDTTNG